MKKGFTLIELLAVIVILAIIALIATPIVLNIIEDAKRSANERSIDNYAHALSNEIARRQMNGDFVSLQDTIDKMEYSGAKVKCQTNKLQSNGQIYLDNCSVDNSPVENFASGEKTHDTSPMISVHTGTNKITGYTLDKTGNIGLDIYSNVSGNSHITYSVNGGNPVTIYPTSTNGDVYYTIPGDPQKMSKPINIKLYLGETEVDSYTTSIKDYASAVLNNPSYSDSYDLIKALLTYGRIEQLAFNVNTSDLPDSILDTPVDLNSIDISKYASYKYLDYSGTKNGYGVQWSGEFYINFREFIYINLKGTTTIDELEVIYDGKKEIPVLSDGRQTIIVPHNYLDLDKEYTLEIVHGDEVFTIYNTMLGYMYNGIYLNTAGYEEIFRLLAKALIYYYDEGNKYYYY